jgi:dephospho-CoA kinase
MLIGVLGGIASGKSEVSAALERLGARRLDADRIGHEVLEDSDVKAALGQRWGAAIFDAQWRVDRRRIAAIVFAAPPRGPAELSFLEQWTHPRIGQRLRDQLATWSRTQQVRVAVLDAPVMLKTGWAALCDQLLYVDAPHAQRLERARRRGWSEAEFDAREAAQEALDVKRSQADVIIDNSSALEYTFAQVNQFWRSQVEPGLGLPLVR